MIGIATGKTVSEKFEIRKFKKYFGALCIPSSVSTTAAEIAGHVPNLYKLLLLFLHFVFH